MKVIAGLGNPGKIYRDSRHNVGFSVVNYLSKLYKVALKKDNLTQALKAKIKIRNQNIIIALPLTFMNLSGAAIRALLNKYKVDLENLLVVCDDLDLEFGRLKLKPAGSSGGHRGIESIIGALGNKNFPRLRIGIGRPKSADIEPKDFVLSTFSKKEKEKIPKIIERASDCCRFWVKAGIIETMNIFNKRSPK